jgi:molecular chaperone GrpE
MLASVRPQFSFVRLFSAAPSTEASPPPTEPSTSNAPPPSAPPPSSPPPPPKKTIESLEKELKAVKTDRLYILAELENSRRRFQRVIGELEATAVEGIAKKLLPVADNLARIRQTGTKQTIGSLLDVVTMVDADLHRIFGEFKIARLKTAGEKFSPEFHEAVTVKDTGNANDSGLIVEEIAAGYTISGRLLRAAKVIVGK